MSSQQREQNPDVNSYNPDTSPAENPGSTDSGNDIERGRKDDVIPVPPDVQPAAPIEEPPTSDRPVGDVDDSPKRIA